MKYSKTANLHVITFTICNVKNAEKLGYLLRVLISNKDYKSQQRVNFRNKWIPEPSV